MRASEWQYLCAAHEPPKACCAIEYCAHTLDWASGTLTSQENFPSRLKLGNEANGGYQAGMRQLINIMRRVYRIFAHAWFQHRTIFWQFESQDGLYVLFKTVCDEYCLIPEENYTIPAEAEGPTKVKGADKRKEAESVLDEHGNPESASHNDADATTTISTGATTRRHRNTPSFSATVPAINEDDEDASTVVPEAEETSTFIAAARPTTAQPSKTAEQTGEDAPSSKQKSGQELQSGTHESASKGKQAEEATNIENEATEKFQDLSITKEGQDKQDTISESGTVVWRGETEE